MCVVDTSPRANALPKETATEAGNMHPTGMHSCFINGLVSTLILESFKGVGRRECVVNLTYTPIAVLCIFVSPIGNSRD